MILCSDVNNANHGDAFWGNPSATELYVVGKCGISDSVLHALVKQSDPLSQCLRELLQKSIPRLVALMSRQSDASSLNARLRQFSPW